MTAIGETILLAAIGDSRVVESATWRAASTPDATAAAVKVTIERLRGESRHDARGTLQISRARISCLPYVHATYGGVVAPAIGDVWSIPRVEGGAAVDGWKAAEADDGGGIWEIDVTLEQRIETGGDRRKE